MKGLFTYTTEIEPQQTVGEIYGELASHGAKSIMTNYDQDRNVESISFFIDTPFGIMAVKLPCNPDPVLKILKEKKLQKRYLTRHQALRISWRIVLYWVKAQMALIEVDMARVEQVFLPYITDKKGVTFYESIVAGKIQLPEGK